MGNRRSPLGILRAPLGHWIIAMILAAGVAWGTHTGLDFKAKQSGQTATLVWDAAVAKHMDPSLADAAEPAVATAQSMLSDAVVASLARSESFPSSATTARVGEFRSRLELHQSSANLLQVGFRDPSPQHAAQTANAVARALTAEASAIPDAPAASATAAATAVPSQQVPAPRVVTPPPAAAKTPAPEKTPVDSAEGSAGPAPADSLGQLVADLTATQKKVDGLSTDAFQRREHPELSSYRESKEQQLLTAQVGAALKQVADLRANPDTSAGAQEPLRQIQEALRSVWPASRADKTARSAAEYAGFNAAGVDADRLRLEKAEFAHTIEVVQKQQQALQRIEPAQPTAPHAAAQAPATAPAAQTASTQPAAESPVATPNVPSSSSVTPPIAESEIPKAPAEEPFRLLRPAGSPMRNPLWPAGVAGAFCGLLYLGIAGSRYRQDEEEYTEEGTPDSGRMITPSRPLRPAQFFEDPEPRPNEPSGNAEPRSTNFFQSAPDSERTIAPAKPLRPADFFAPSALRPNDIAESAEPRSPDFFESAADSQRMITPARPLRSAEFFGRPDPRQDAGAQSAEPRSASFFERAEPHGSSIAESSDSRSADTFDNPEPRSTGFFESAQPRSAGFFATVEPSPAETIHPRTPVEVPDLPGSSHDERSTEVRVQEIAMDADETKRPFQEEGVSEETAADPWVDNMMKTLSETSIGRMYDKPTLAEGEAESEEAQRFSVHPDRLAG